MKPFRSLLTGNFRFSNVDDFSLARQGVYAQVLLHDEAKDGKRIEQTKHVPAQYQTASSPPPPVS